jgi:hypothetical protein
MKWLKRGLWIAAWAVWLWLGFGLYRELPRGLGPPVSVVCLVEDERVAGFLPDDRTIITLLDVEGATRVTLHDVETGRNTQQWQGPPGLASDDTTSATYGVLSQGGGFFDLETGRWAPHNLWTQRNPDLHRWRPWALIRPSIVGGDDAVVVDRRTGRTIFTRRVTRKDEYDFHGAFFVGEDQVAVCARRVESGFPPAAAAHFTIELWTVSDPAIPPDVVDRLYPGEEQSAAKGGRVAWLSAGSPAGIEVYDFAEKRQVFSIAPEARAGALRGFPPILSDDGYRLLDVARGSLWDVTTRKPLWQESIGEDLAPPEPRTVQRVGRFEVEETWDVQVGEWKPPDTYAVRRLDTGRVEFRCTTSLLGRNTLISDDFTRWCDGSAVYELPPPPNWTLLGISQAVLALPFVLLWALLRWRRKRRIRLDTAAA